MSTLYNLIQNCSVNQTQRYSINTHVVDTDSNLARPTEISRVYNMSANLQRLELYQRHCTVPKNSAPSTRGRVHV